MSESMVSMIKEQKLLNLMETTGYNIVQENGQRVFGPPPDWPSHSPQPEKGCEVFVGKIPRDCYEDELFPVFAKIGKIYQLRLMMDFSGTNRGYAFVTFTNQLDAKQAIQVLNGFQIRPNKRIGVVKSLDNCRLFIGGIPLSKSRNDVVQELSKVTEGVVNAIVYNQYNNSNKLVFNSGDKPVKNRGFAFVEYSSHRAAAMARRKLLPGKILLWGSEVTVDWAIPEPHLDDNIMSKVTVLFVRYLSPDATEDLIKETFSLNDSHKVNVQRVKRMKNYAFVHFYTREDAELVLKIMSKSDLSKTGLSEFGQQLEITWAKPPNASNTYQRRKSRHYGSNNSGGDVPNIKNNPFSPNYGPVLNPLSPPFEFNHSNGKHLQTPTLLSNLMSGDSNNWNNNIRNSPVIMSGLRHSRNNATPVWYSIENQYPWLPFGVIRSPQSIGVFRSPQPYNVFQ